MRKEFWDQLLPFQTFEPGGAVQRQILQVWQDYLCSKALEGGERCLLSGITGMYRDSAGMI